MFSYLFDCLCFHFFLSSLICLLWAKLTTEHKDYHLWNLANGFWPEWWDPLFLLAGDRTFSPRTSALQDFTGYSWEGLTQNHALGKLPRGNSHIQGPSSLNFSEKRPKVGVQSWDNPNSYLLRKTTVLILSHFCNYNFSQLSNHLH